MTGLQLRIAGILIGAITLVVAVATLIGFVAISYPAPERSVVPVAFQIRALNAIANNDSAVLSPITNAEVAALGPQRPDLTNALRSRLRADGIDLPVTAYGVPNSSAAVAIVDIDGRQVAIDFPTEALPPLDFWLAIGAWMALIVIGVIVVSLVMAYRVTRPFALLEQAVGTVGPDGILPHLPETGSGEARETAMVLNRLSDRLRTAMESRMRLVAAAGHDFRTPMTRMRLRAEFLAEEDRLAWIKDIDELERIADSAIGLVREEVSEAPMQDVALDQLLLGEVEDLVAQGYALQLDHLDPAVLPLPPLAIRRALRNLLINAATHGGGARISMVAAEGTCVIAIRDEGPGIPEDLLKHVFEPFFRAAPGRMKTIPGAGLGLALALEIIERIGGKLELSNRREGGLEQKLSLQIAATSSQSGKATE